ncbi:MAG: response regulator [Gammaproteobacteria bacterium]
MQETTFELSNRPELARPASILVVDDDRDSREALQGILELDGYDVRCAADGPSALIVAASFVPDIVFLDIHMPQMDGYDVCQRMRRMGKLHGARIFALTALDTERHAQRCVLAGFDGRLTKPLNPQRLTQLLRPRTH